MWKHYKAKILSVVIVIMAIAIAVISYRTGFKDGRRDGLHYSRYFDLEEQLAKPAPTWPEP